MTSKIWSWKRVTQADKIRNCSKNIQNNKEERDSHEINLLDNCERSDMNCSDCKRENNELDI